MERTTHGGEAAGATGDDGRSGPTRVALSGVTATAALALVPRAAAHTGTTHAGTPHVALLALVVLGAGLAVAGLRVDGDGRGSGALALVGGLVLAGVGAVGLVEVQIVAEAGPTLARWYPLASLVVGSGLAVGSLVVGHRRWPNRPRYAALGVLLAGWVVYPVAMPNGGVRHPLGYLLVLAVPVLVAHVVRQDARPTVRRVLADARARRAVLGIAPFVAVVLAFSAGTVTLNPDAGVNAPTDPYLVTLPVVDPLVAWPAVEFGLPSVPVGGMVSVGTLVLFGTLGTLVGLNVGTLVERWSRETARESAGRPLLGTAATTGATACCCCAPAAYGVASALLGGAATPVYWAFTDTSSPLGGAFLAASVLLLTGSLVGSAGAGAARDPRAVAAD